MYQVYLTIREMLAQLPALHLYRFEVICITTVDLAPFRAPVDVRLEPTARRALSECPIAAGQQSYAKPRYTVD